MMYIDNRLLTPFVLPFLLLGMTRGMFFVAGAEWTDPAVAAVLSLIVGGVVGFCIMGWAFDAGKSFGGFWIGSRHDRPNTR